MFNIKKLEVTPPVGGVTQWRRYFALNQYLHGVTGITKRRKYHDQCKVLYG